MPTTTEAEVEKVKVGIAAYAHEQLVVLRILRKHGELTERDFDRIFSDFKSTVGSDGMTRRSFRKPKMRFCPTTGDSFLLGGFPQRTRDQWLHLTQLMCLCGLVKIKTENGLVVYSAP